MTNRNRPSAPTGVVREQPADRLPALVHPEWQERFPWLVQGTTTRGDASRPFDLRLFGDAPVDAAVEGRWEELRSACGARSVVHARQVHGARVRAYAELPPGLSLADPCDAHVTARPGILLAVATADCVPVFLVDATHRAVGMVHAGWRGVAAGVLEEALSALREGWSSAPQDVHVHLGPAICGRCYEVGPEVFAALGAPVPSRPEPVDLRRVLADRAEAAGVPRGRTTVSAHCTRCTGSALFSHRGGDDGRQVGFLGVRPADTVAP